MPGNHDTVLDATAYPEHAAVRAAFLSALAPHVTLLEQSAATYRGLRVWGSPVLVSRIETQGQRYYSDGFETREAARAPVWEQIPEALDVLVTHTPSFGGSGDPLLAARLQRMTRPPRVHCFGHAHREVGVGMHPHGAAQWPGDAEGRAKRLYINAAQEKILGGEHGSGGAAWVFDLEVAAGQ